MKLIALVIFSITCELSYALPTDPNSIHLVNPLIDNTDALKARYDMWNDPDASRFYMSTFEFDEDSVGLAQIKWATERAQEGKNVDIVLDGQGHALSENMIRYMRSKGVRVHIFSPSKSLRGIKKRYQSERKSFGPIRSAFNATFKQMTARMHDKILYNNSSNTQRTQLLHSNENTGQAILGGRNATDSHYGLDMRFTPNDSKIGHGANPHVEKEHEILVHSSKVNQEVEQYIDDMLKSHLTEDFATNQFNIANGDSIKLDSKNFRLDPSIESEIVNRLEENDKWLKENIIAQKPRNWIARATRIEDAEFISDDIHKTHVTKKVMNHAWNIIRQSKGDIWFNSQYGTPTPSAQRAISQFTNQNSAITRLVANKMFLTDISYVAADEHITDLIKIIETNKEEIKSGIYYLQSDYSADSKKEKLRTRLRVARHKTMIDHLSGLFGEEEVIKEKIDKYQLMVKNKVSPDVIFNTFINDLKKSKSDMINYYRLFPELHNEKTLKLVGHVDNDPTEVLGPYKQKNFYFMTNDPESWVLQFDQHIHHDFHLALEEIWRDLGKGVNVAGFKGPGRIHSKVITTPTEALVWSANVDYRSERINTEVGLRIKAESTGNSVIRAYEQHLQSYMMPAKWHIRDGKFISPSRCPNYVKRLILKGFLRYQL